MNDSGKQDVIKSGKRLVEAKQKFLENFKNLHGQLPPEKMQRAKSVLEDAFLICHLETCISSKAGKSVEVGGI